MAQLMHYGECYGTIGTRTNITDIYGHELCVGDVVLISRCFRKPIAAFVCETNKPFVMGCYSVKWENGKAHGMQIELSIPFSELSATKIREDWKIVD